ncbi:hypothetical protein ACFLQ0_02035 [Nitrospinota bacterium]
MLRAMKHLRVRVGGYLLLAAFVLAGCVAASEAPGSPAIKAAAGKPGRFVIAGLVADAAGMPVSQLPVRVLSSTRPLQADPRLGSKFSRLLVSGETASDGTYRFVVPIQPGARRYYLSFYATGRFDDVRFARPDRIDITSRVKPGGSFLFDYRLAFHGAWVRVQETLKAYPKNSAKAHIIRRYGIAEEIRKAEGKKPEVWWYYSKGKKFDFRGEKIVGEKSFLPILK